jgi:hypothetical protein
MRRLLWNILFLVLFGAIGARADVIYTFLATDASFPGGQLAFQLTVPDFIDAPIDTESLFFSCAQLDSSTNCGDTVAFWISSGSSSPDQLDFGADNSIDYAFGFPGGSFTTPGTQTCCGNVASLMVAAVPEPRADILLVMAVAMLGVLRRTT